MPQLATMQMHQQYISIIIIIIAIEGLLRPWRTKRGAPQMAGDMKRNLPTLLEVGVLVITMQKGPACTPLAHKAAIIAINIPTNTSSWARPGLCTSLRTICTVTTSTTTTLSACSRGAPLPTGRTATYPRKKRRATSWMLPCTTALHTRP